MQLFDDPGDYLAFIRVLSQGLERYPQARPIAYCLMPNHWHIVFWPKRGADRVLSELMRWVGTTHVRRWHEHRHSVGTGPIYQGRFKSFPIQADDHLLTVCRYVERNAMRAGLVDRAEAWRWGSLWLRNQTKGLEPEEQALQAILDDGPVPRPRNWQAMVNRPQNAAEVEALRRSVIKGKPFGTTPWSERTAERLGITLRGRGRPKRPE